VASAGAAGCVAGLVAGAIGPAAVAWGAGRAALDAVIDPAVGFHITAKPGDEVSAGTALATIYARTVAAAEQAQAALQRAIPIAAEPAAALPLISHRVTRAGVEEYRPE
jgi:thymidine phosphorylase